MLPYFNHLLHLDGSKPLSTSACDGDVLDFAGYFTALVKSYPANLWQEDPAVLNLKALRKPYAIIQASLLEHRSSLQRLAFIKAIPESPIHILQLLLQYL